MAPPSKQLWLWLCSTHFLTSHSPFLAPTYFISAPGLVVPTPDVRARELRSRHLRLATALSDLFMAMPDLALPSPPPSSRYANRSPILAQFCICSARLSLRIPPSASPARARAGRDCTRSHAVDEAARSCRLLIVSGWSISRFFRISPARIFRAARSLTGDAVRAVEAIEWDCVPGLQRARCAIRAAFGLDLGFPWAWVSGVLTGSWCGGATV